MPVAPGDDMLPPVDTDAATDGVDQVVEPTPEAAAEPAPVETELVDEHITRLPDELPAKLLSEKEILVRINVDSQGNGSGFAGVDADQVEDATCPSGDVTYSESHTIGITRLTLTNSTVHGGPVFVLVTTK